MEILLDTMPTMEIEWRTAHLLPRSTKKSK
jgi:hypothetical protein